MDEPRLGYKLLGPPIAQGSVGKIYLARKKSNGQTVVVKFLTYKTEKSEARALRETEIWQYLGCRHKNIACLLDAVSASDGMMLVSEYVPGAIDLSTYPLPDLSTAKGRSKLLSILEQLADGLEYMHSMGVAHSDIKPKNILMKGDTPVYIDFDVACTLPQLEKKQPFEGKYQCKSSSLVGTPNNIAPEVWRKTLGRSPRAADVYALGVTFYFAANKRRFPYEGRSIEELKENALTRAPRPSESGFPRLDRLVMQMIEKDPIARPTASEVRKELRELIEQTPS